MSARIVGDPTDGYHTRQMLPTISSLESMIPWESTSS